MSKLKSRFTMAEALARSYFVRPNSNKRGGTLFLPNVLVGHYYKLMPVDKDGKEIRRLKV